MPTASPSLQAAPLAGETPTQAVALSIPAVVELSAKKYRKIPVEKRGVERGGSGWPEIPHIQFEKRSDRPGFTVWYAPEGSNAPRSTKTYLGYIGKRLLDEWEALPDSERVTAIERWMKERRGGVF